LLAHVHAHHARADALHDATDGAGIVIEQSPVIGSGRSAGTLTEVFGIERQSRGWEGIDHCGDMVTGD
jgi:hypothetical protein